ncbi:MAG: hypothetical protein KGI73_01690 [Patescibacteria group bacterium]|nr:hypothetical protein [Patescibacteria group bacterium]
MIEVIPSLPAQTFAELEEKIGRVVGAVKTFQIDICDGMFVTNRTWPLNPGDRSGFERMVKGDDALPHWQDMDFEADLMVHTPEKLIPDLVKVGFIRALIHIEAKHDFAAVRAAAGESMELGVALSPGTPIERIDAYIEHIGVIQLMGIAKIGAQGQPFDPRVLDMIRAVRARYPRVTIEVDGSVNADTAPQLVEAGATRLAPGSYIFRAADPKAAAHALESLPTI